MKNLARAVVNLVLAALFATCCVSQAASGSPVGAVAYGVGSGFMLAIALGYAAFYLEDRRARQLGCVASGSYGGSDA